MTMLSQLNNVPPDFFLYWAIIAMFVVGGIGALVSIWSNLRQRPPHETPTRREFDSLAGKVAHIESSLPHMERRILEAVNSGSEKLAGKIEKLAETDHNERVKIWEEIHKEDKDLGERIASLEAKQKP